MNTYLPFAALPIAVSTAWFAASSWTDSEPGRYRLPAVTQIEQPSIPAARQSQYTGQADVQVAAFLPHVPTRSPDPDPTLILNSVMTGTDMDLASINGRLVKKGDQVEGYLVQRITREGVELVARGETRYLPMRPLHELPPPVRAGVDSVQGNAAARDNADNLTQNFWATFDSSQTQL